MANSNHSTTKKISRSSIKRNTFRNNHSKNESKIIIKERTTKTKKIKVNQELMLDELSVFYPAYNEAGRVGNTINKTFDKLPKIAKKFEVLIVNDGSKDETAVEVIELQKKYKDLIMETHSPNKGYGEALKTGFYKTRYNWIVFTDVDGQFEFDEVSDFIKVQSKTSADLVIGYYRKREVPLFRKINTFIWQKIVFLLFGLNVRDIDCAFKLINRKVINEIGILESGRGAFISSELLIKARAKKFKIVEIPVTHYPRIGGKGTGANLDVIIQSFVDLFKLWAKLKLGM